ncbi:MAG: sugar phosphate isomerase/epimerase [Microbacteriaceae bacterium]|nr:MAG: sugar phosphate isomerase/epimerase [Microbacteriaceae bacterium]
MHMKPHLTASQWIFGREPLSDTVERLERLGYDGIELAGEPDGFSAKDLSDLRSRELEVPSICGLYSPDRDLSHPDSSVRTQAQDYVVRCAELMSSFGSGVVIVVPTAVGRTSPISSRQSELGNAAESLARIAARISGSNVRLVVEALNRYETYLVNTVTAAHSLAEATGSQDVGVMLDTFHMSIEEPDPVPTLSTIKDRLWHVQLADSNRRPPGQGHLDFRAIFAALEQMNYAGSVAMEYLPAAGNPYDVRSLGVSAREKDANCRAAIAVVRQFLGAAN